MYRILLLIPDVINPERQNCAYPAIQVPEAINPGRAISYTMQNHSSNPVYPAILVSTLRELLVMPCKIVAVTMCTRRYWYQP